MDTQSEKHQSEHDETIRRISILEDQNMHSRQNCEIAKLGGHDPPTLDSRINDLGTTTATLCSALQATQSQLHELEEFMNKMKKLCDKRTQQIENLDKRLSRRIKKLEDFDLAQHLHAFAVQLDEDCKAATGERLDSIRGELASRLNELERVDHVATTERLNDFERQFKMDHDSLLDLEARFSYMTTFEFAMILADKLYPKLLHNRDERVAALGEALKKCEDDVKTLKEISAAINTEQVNVLLKSEFSELYETVENNRESIQRLEKKIAETVYVHPDIARLTKKRKKC